MAVSGTWFEKWLARVKRNPFFSAAVALAAVVAAISSFTDSAKNVLALIPHKEARPDINGRWQAEVVYDWEPKKHAEVFNFDGEGGEVRGTASFLGVGRTITSGVVNQNQVIFVTRSLVGMRKRDSRELAHRYRGKMADGRIRFTLQTENDTYAHSPVEFTAVRATALPTRENAGAPGDGARDQN